MQRRTKVLHVTNSLNYGGLERVIIDICRFLDPSEFDPMVACIKWKGPQAQLLEDANIPVVTLKKKDGWLAKYTTFLELKKIIRTHAIDVIHTHNTGPLLEAMAARFVSLSFPKIIHTDHTRSRWPDKKKYMIFERIASNFVYSMIAVSSEAKENLVYFEHIPESRIEIIDNGIPVDNFQPEIIAHEIKKELQIDQFEYVIGLCVVHRKQKGIKHLLKALPAILTAYSNVVCVIGGDGPEKQALEKLTVELNLQNNVRFIGPRNDVGRILSIFDIYVLPSEWEGLPLSLLEAMAARKCIIATSVGGVTKALEGGKCGVLVPPAKPEELANAVAALLNSPGDRATLAAEAFRCVNEKYSASIMAQSYGKRYKLSLSAQ